MKRIASLTIAMSGLVFNPALVSAQVPGVPSTQPVTTKTTSTQTTPTTSKTTTSPVLSGGVKVNMTAAEKLLSQGKWSDAEGLFREALVANPTDVPATLGLGLALANEFKLDNADSAFERVIAIDPNNATAYAGKAMVMLNRLQSSSGTIRNERESILKQAEDYARRATTLGPANADAHNALGQVLKEQGRNEEAASELNTATVLNPDMSFAYSSLGLVRMAQNSPAEASEAFKRAITLNSGNSSAHYGLGAVLLKQGQIDDAIKELNTSLYQFPNSWPVRMALGQAYQTQGNTVAALQQYQLSTLIKPENIEPYVRMADIHQERGDSELALADLRSGLTQAPTDLQLRQRIADLDMSLERADDAIKNYRVILQLSPNDNNAMKGLSQALLIKAQKAALNASLSPSDYETANNAIDEAIKVNSDDMELRLAKAKLLAMSGATEFQAKYANIQPTTDGDRVGLAEVLATKGDFNKSAQLFNEVITRQTNPKQLYAIADIAALTHSLGSAETAYKKGLALGGSPERGQVGLKKVADARKSAVDATAVASELAHKHQWDGAIAKFREAIKSDPMLPTARYGLAEALDDGPEDSVPTLSESASQYQYYLAIATDLTDKDREKLTDLIEKLNDKVAKLKQKEERDN
ncbi:MAG TPA: tetratricopeptide repeat protein [Drouetiella sp.]